MLSLFLCSLSLKVVFGKTSIELSRTNFYRFGYIMFPPKAEVHKREKNYK